MCTEIIICLKRKWLKNCHKLLVPDKLLYPAFLVILLVTENIGRGERAVETTGKILQIEVKENSPFY